MTDKNIPEKKVEVIRTKATSIAQSCPVCNSFGTLKYGQVVCHGCAGRGYILIPAEEVKS